MFKFIVSFFALSISLLAQDLVLNGKDTTMYGVYTYNNVTLTNGSIIRVAVYDSATQKGKIIIYANSISIDGSSQIIANGAGNAGLSIIGYAGGAGHGGQGGYSASNVNTGGTTYGTLLGNGVDMGSKGSDGSTSGSGGMGGGAISLFCTTFILHGNITANGLNGSNDGNYRATGGGGGSGSGILINAKNIVIDGGISANGGSGGDGTYYGSQGGGGGGGRVKIFYLTKNISGIITVTGGPNGQQAGFAGTISYDNYTSIPALIAPTNTISVRKPTFRLVSTDNDSAAILFYKIEISQDTFKTIYSTYDQTIDPTGWSKVQYASGDTASFTSPDNFPDGYYYYRGYAYDGHVWSSGWDVQNPVPTTYNEFTVNENLPIELTSFIANISNGIISLNWKTATEVNNMGFNVERSANKSDWTKIAFVQGHQNSTSTISYSYVDKSVSQAGNYYYRLKQLDNNGSYKYSNIVEADLIAPSVFDLSQNFPNPFNPSTKINYNLPFDSKVTLEVYDITGERISQLVNEERSAGYYSVDFGSAKLSSGVYFYRITAVDKAKGDNFSAIKKMILLK